MVQAEDVRARQEAVTPERFAAAKTYEHYTASIKNNVQKFAANYEGTRVPEAIAQRLRALRARPGGPAKVLVIGEDWCPDVYRGLPVLKRIAEAAGWELRVVERDQHLDIAEHFKKDGEFLSVPTVVFYTADFKYITHWIERPAAVTAVMRDATGPIFAGARTEVLAQKLGHEPTDEEKAEARREMQHRYDEFQATSADWARWRDMTVEDITAVLERAAS